MYKLILLDLDGTLLHSDKTISDYTASVLEECKRNGFIIGVSTARGESNAVQYIKHIRPDVIISSGGAFVRYKKEIVYCCTFDERETRRIIDTGFELTDNQCEITIDTLDAHYWNYKEDPHILSPDWGEVRYTDYSDFKQPSLKICVELPDEGIAKQIAAQVDCDYARFSDGDWYKFSKKEATKEKAIEQTVHRLGISEKEIIAFGDDFVDIEMLRLCGRGVAMGNAIAAVKEIADDVTKSNDEDGVAYYLEKVLLAGGSTTPI